MSNYPYREHIYDRETKEKELSELLNTEVSILSSSHELEMHYQTLAIGEFGTGPFVTYNTGETVWDEFCIVVRKELLPKAGVYELELEIVYPDLFQYSLKLAKVRKYLPWVECYRKDY